jgi:hypothetical protein
MELLGTTAYYLNSFSASETEPLWFRKNGMGPFVGLVGASKFTFFLEHIPQYP